jgi:hypothetical protein
VRTFLQGVVLPEAGQHREISLIQDRTAVPLNVAGQAPLLFGSTVLCQGGVEKEKRQRADDKAIVVHGSFFAPGWRRKLPFLLERGTSHERRIRWTGALIGATKG